MMRPSCCHHHHHHLCVVFRCRDLKNLHFVYWVVELSCICSIVGVAFRMCLFFSLALSLSLSVSSKIHTHDFCKQIISTKTITTTNTKPQIIPAQSHFKIYLFLSVHISSLRSLHQPKPQQRVSISTLVSYISYHINTWHFHLSGRTSPRKSSNIQTATSSPGFVVQTQFQLVRRTVRRSL